MDGNLRFFGFHPQNNIKKGSCHSERSITFFITFTASLTLFFPSLSLRLSEHSVLHARLVLFTPVRFAETSFLYGRIFFKDLDSSGFTLRMTQNKDVVILNVFPHLRFGSRKLTASDFLVEESSSKT